MAVVIVPSPAARTRGLRVILSLDVLAPALRPLVRAWILGSLWTVGPRVCSLALRHVVAGQKPDSPNHDDDVAGMNGLSPTSNSRRFLKELATVLKDGCLSNRFPTFCAILVGGSSLLEGPVERLLRKVRVNGRVRRRHVRWSTTFIAAWASLRLLQTRMKIVQLTPSDSPSEEAPTAGSTIDLTLFAFVRAADILLCELWSHCLRYVGSGTVWSRISIRVRRAVDPLVFSVSCALIMWAFVYHPDRLPRAYNRWISSAAAVDVRLLEILRRCRRGEYVYGANMGRIPLVESLCVDYGCPTAWADPSVTVPLPCEIVHMGRGPSCERHALVRFGRSFGFALATYVPLSLAGLLARMIFGGRGGRRDRISAGMMTRVFRSATRSSLFLASFITLFYYGVCLARSRVGPWVLGTSLAARQRIDEGICVAVGCALCGWSVCVETAGRQKDMALFVAPRALATLVPRRYPASMEWRETLVFAASAAVVLNCAMEDPSRVRGVLGLVLGKLLRG